MGGYPVHIDRYGSWLEVPLTVLPMLNLSLSEFSQHSHISNDGCIFLDENGDAMIFIRRYRSIFGEQPTIATFVDHGKTSEYIRTMNKNIRGYKVVIH